MEEEFPYRWEPVESNEYRDAVAQYPPESFAVILDYRAQGKVVVVKEVLNRPDGPCVKTVGSGLIPTADLRPATEQEIEEWKTRHA